MTGCRFHSPGDRMQVIARHFFRVWPGHFHCPPDENEVTGEQFQMLRGRVKVTAQHLKA